MQTDNTKITAEDMHETGCYLYGHAATLERMGSEKSNVRRVRELARLWKARAAARMDGDEYKEATDGKA